MSDTKAPPPPIPSSTVMVIRPLSLEGEGFELFMVRRHSKSRFMPDRYVFPGGRLEGLDSSPAALTRLYGYEPGSATPLFRDVPGAGAQAAEVKLSQEQQAGLYVAAFRELFEEAGVLLAVEESTGQPVNIEADDHFVSRLAAYRQESQANQLDFITMLEGEKLMLDFNQLIYFSHWITPITEPYRFDARFFLAQVPLDQLAESDHLETTDGVWITPQDALNRAQAGEFNIAFPTIMHIEWLNAHSTAPEACQAARRKTVVAAMPNQLEDDENGPVFRLPDDVINRW